MNMFANMFSTKPQPAPTNPSPTGDKPLSASSPTTDEKGLLPGSEPVPVNPLDAYKKMYENGNNSSDIQAPSFKIDPKVLGEVSNSMDLTKGIQPELMEKALAGDVKSLLSVIQSVGRNSYSASLEHTTALTETHLSQRADFDSKKLNAGVKSQLTTNELSNAPNYDHPVVKAELNRVAEMFSKANPDASPQQIALAAQKHLTELSSALNPGKTAEQQKADSGEVDWSSYLKQQN